ncbi:proteasome component M29 [Coniosporium tulheliwenetii]|uniref:Proteasome component M29 n=1 Tax=Coniosporium tulheliwenetii TaxID=3383036 RepID=A0ACC2ZBQ1_9PEZI|nr:proteasome component M29 [Cladosporium sp. JES 115]
MATASAEKELSLVGKVELRIALADSDEKLEALLKTYLAPLLLKLASEHASVRNRIFHLLLRVLGHLQLPPRGSKEDEELRNKFEVSDDDAKALSTWFGKLILLVVSRTPAAGSAVNETCPGLSTEDYQFLTQQGKAEVWDPTKESGLNLIETKVTVAKLLASGIFTDEERFLPAVFASADTNSRIAEIGDDILKRATQSIDLEDATLVQVFYDIYLGGQPPQGPPAVRPALRIKLLSLLTKSVASTKFPERIVRIVEEGLAPEQQDSTSSRGREISKLRSAIFSFANFVARRGSPADVQSIAPVLVDRLRAFIEDQGWPTPNRDEDISLRCYGYEVIGLLAKAAPQQTLIEPDLRLLAWLFRSLREDSSGSQTAVSIEEALSAVIGAFTGLTQSDVQDSLRKLLLAQVEISDDRQTSDAKIRSTRYPAVRFANRCLPYSDAVARWIDILVIVQDDASSKHELVEEGRRGLDPHWYKLLSTTQVQSRAASPMLSDFDMPDFATLVHFVFTQSARSDGSASDLDGPDHGISPSLHNFIRLHSKALAPSVKFCHQVLMSQALSSEGITIPIDADWERKLETAYTTDPKARSAIRVYIKSASRNEGEQYSALLILLQAAFEGLLWNEGNGLGDCGAIFVSLCSLCPDDLLAAAGFTRRFRLLELPVFSNDRRVRVQASHAFGLLATQESCNQDNVSSSLSVLLGKLTTWKGAIGAAVNQVSGAIVALSYFFSRLSYRGRSSAVPEASFRTFLETLFDILKSSPDSSIRAACFSAIDQLSLFYAIEPSSIEAYMPFRSVVDKIMETAKTGNEHSIIALGHLAMTAAETGDDSTETSDLSYTLERMYQLHEVRQAESQFAVGEALSCLACGWDSTALASQLDVEGQVPSGATRTKTLGEVLDKILIDCKNTKPSLKKASVIWAMCLVQFCGHRPEVQQRLRRCQAAFGYCLSDRDEIVQEAASRGLGLVYEKGDRQLKDELVRDLVGSFSENKTDLSGRITEDTQLFEPGALPTGEGSVTTYKDILSLASEVGDSSLVYRFMSLAANNAIWSSRAAFGRFGLSNVFSDSSVDGYLAENPKLYPKLYRYRFDPNSNVQRSMNDIWNALVKDSSSTLEKYFDAIMEDLLQNILAREWRVRQASCAAIADLVQGRKLEKVLDDIKESVRAAAAALARVLTGVLTRSLEAGEASSKAADAMLKHVLPFLLSTSGLESSATEVQAFALDTLLQIIKKSSGKTLRPFIPELVERLLGLLSSLEPQAVNYLHLNASKYNLTEQKIDDMRLASIRGSPLTEAIERCLDLVDEPTMEALVPHLESALKSAVGLPSKVGCSRILVSLSTRHNALFRPHADHFLKLIEKQVLDFNPTVSSSYAVSAGYVARVASDKQILRLIAFSKRLYFASDDDRSRIASGDIVHAFSKHAPDRFNALAVELLPFVFVAKHDSHEHVKEQFQSAWDAHVGGPRAVLLYLKDIVTLAQEHLDSPRWVLKHTAARAIADAVMSASSASDELSVADAEVLWPAIDKAMAGKTWEGKEVVLAAFVRFVEKGGQLWKARSNVAGQINKVIIREAKRQNAAYRQYTLGALGQVAAARTDMDMSETVMDIVEPVIEELTATNEDAMEVDGESKVKDDKVRDKTLAGAIESLCASANPTSLPRALQLVASANSVRSNDVQLALFEALLKMFQRLGKDHPGFREHVSPQARITLASLIFDPRYNDLSEALRLKRSRMIGAAAEVAGLVQPVLKERLPGEIESEKSLLVRQELERAYRALG